MSIAAEKDFYVEKGTDWGRTLRFRNTQGPIDVTGYQFRGQIKKDARSSAVLANIAFDTSDASSGVVKMSLTHIQTSSIPSSGTKFDETVEYPYDIERTNQYGKVKRILNGVFQFSPEVTR